MTLRGSVSDVGQRRFTFRQTIVAVAAILFVGFLLVQTSAAQAVFGYVASLLAIGAAGVLTAAGYDVVRTGIEIRDVVSGHAVAVTSACDGSGLLISFAGAIVLLSAWRTKSRFLGIAAPVVVASILLFNLIRILALFLSIGAPAVMSAQHLYVAPLLSVVLVAGLAASAREIHLRETAHRPLRWLLVAVAAAAVWYEVRQPVTCAAVVPLANALLWLLPTGAAATISCTGPDGAVLVTNAAMISGSVLSPPFYPEDFTLALPLVVASLASDARPMAVAKGLFVTLALFSIAMTFGAVTAGHDAATAAGVKMLREGGLVQLYRPPGPTTLALLKAVQNVVVHFNLFLLPVIFAMMAALPASPAGAQVPAAARRRRRR